MPDIQGRLKLAGPEWFQRLDAVVRLEDVTFADAPSTIMAETRCCGEAGDSLAFTIHISESSLRAGRSYSLSARGFAEGSGRRRSVGTVVSYPWRTEGALSETDAARVLELEELD